MEGRQQQQQQKSLKVVEIDGHVVLKIMKHCQEAAPANVTGSLLGLDVDATLEVTHCFPSYAPSGEDDEELTESLQMDMMRNMRMVNVDCFTVGWYQSTFLTSFLTESVIANQLSYQENLDKCVCVMFDPLLSSQGKLALKALRLSDKFRQLYTKGQFTKQSLRRANLDASDLFEEIPIKIRNSLLVTAALAQLKEEARGATPSRGVHGFPATPFLQRNIDFMTDCIDDLSVEFNKLQYHNRTLARQKAQQEAFLQRRRAENEARKEAGQQPLDDDLSQHPLFQAPPEPGRLESLLISAQISSHCHQFSGLAGDGMVNVFAGNPLQRFAQQE